MKLIIAGSRKLTVSNSFIEGALELFKLQGKVNVFVNGDAFGIDACGNRYAESLKKHCKDIEIKQFIPDYVSYPKHKAPLIRNSKMAAYADALLLIWDGKSSGSYDIKYKVKNLNKPVYEIIIKEDK